ncbi:hypothetical protein D918_06850 [Trichuris suis]|nr:hypothetical protein D918_06850 [Trichuris suis]
MYIQVRRRALCIDINSLALAYGSCLNIEPVQTFLLVVAA